MEQKSVRLKTLSRFLKQDGDAFWGGVLDVEFPYPFTAPGVQHRRVSRVDPIAPAEQSVGAAGVGDPRSMANRKGLNGCECGETENKVLVERRREFGQNEGLITYKLAKTFSYGKKHLLPIGCFDIQIGWQGNIIKSSAMPKKNV